MLSYNTLALPNIQRLVSTRSFMSAKKRNIIIFIGIALILAIFLFSHFGGSSRAPKSGPVSISISQVIQQDVTVMAEAVGTVQAYNTVNVTSLVDGQLLSVGFKEGDMVQPGQILFQIDPRPFQVQLAQAQAGLAKDQASLSTAESALRRNAALLPQGFVAKQDYDTLKNNAAALAATIKADQATVANAQLQLSHATITAPIQGKTGSLLVQVGNLVKASNTNPLVIINQISPIYVAFTLPQEKLPYIQNEMAAGAVPVYVEEKIQPDGMLQGTLGFIDNTVDPTTGSIQMKATFPNKDLKLWPGQFVNVKIPQIQIKNALLVPTDAVQAGPNGNYVYVVNANNTVSLRPVTPGASIGENTVITQGLKLGETIVTAGQLRLIDGAQVKVIKNK